MQKITAFTDCNSESIVVRLPYEMIVQIIQLLPVSPEQEELTERVKVAAHRSNKLTEMLKSAGLYL
jgi:hypothetical protein